MREIFERIEDNRSTFYEVDIDASEFKEGNPWLFSVFLKFDSSN